MEPNANAPQPPLPPSGPVLSPPPSTVAQHGAATSPRKSGKRKWIVGGVVVVLALGAIGSMGKPTGATGPLPSPTEAGGGLAAVATTAPTIVPTASVASTAATEPPTTAPTVEPTAEPTPKPTPVPAILKKAGRGDKVVKMAAQDTPTIAKITAKGSGNFAVISYIGSAYDDLLVNEIGSYAGTVYVNAGVTRLKVTASGSWTIQVVTAESARSWNGASKFVGKGDSVVQLDGAASYTTTIRNKGRGNFAVIAYSLDGEYLDLLVNEIGSYNGEIMLPDSDPILLVLHAFGGTWSMSAVQP